MVANKTIFIKYQFDANSIALSFVVKSLVMTGIMPPMCMGTQLQVRDKGEDSYQYPVEIKYYKTYKILQNSFEILIESKFQAQNITCTMKSFMIFISYSC